jgi:hypothetical protein
MIQNNTTPQWSIKIGDFLYIRVGTNKSIVKITGVDVKRDLVNYDIVATNSLDNSLGSAQFKLSSFSKNLDELDFCTAEDWQYEWAKYTPEAEKFMKSFSVMKSGSFYSFIDKDNFVYVSKVIAVERNCIAIETHTKDTRGLYHNALSKRFLLTFGEKNRENFSSAILPDNAVRVPCIRDHLFKVAEQGGSISQELMDHFSVTKDALISHLNPPTRVLGDLFIASSVALLGTKLLGNAFKLLPNSSEQKRIENQNEEKV